MEYDKIIDAEVINEEIIEEISRKGESTSSNKKEVSPSLKIIFNMLKSSSVFRLFVAVPLSLLIFSSVITAIEVIGGNGFSIVSLLILPGYYLALLLLIFIKNKVGSEINLAISLIPRFGWIISLFMSLIYYWFGAVLFSAPLGFMISLMGGASFFVVLGLGLILFLVFEKYFIGFVNKGSYY